METPKRIPALADIAAAPTSTAMISILGFMLLFKVFCHTLTYTKPFLVSCIVFPFDWQAARGAGASRQAKRGSFMST